MGRFSSCDHLAQLLLSLKPETHQKLPQAFEERFGNTPNTKGSRFVDLRDLVEPCYRGLERERAIALAEGDFPKAWAIALDKAFSSRRFWSRARKVAKILDEIPHEQAHDTLREFAKRKGVAGENSESLLAHFKFTCTQRLSEFKSDNLVQLCSAKLEDDPIEAKFQETTLLLRLSDEAWFRNWGKASYIYARPLLKALEECSRSELSKLKEKYKNKRSGATLTSCVSASLPKSPYRDAIESLICGNEADYHAAKLRIAIVDRRVWPGRPIAEIKAKGDHKLCAAVQRYEQNYRPDIEDAWGKDLERKIWRCDYGLVAAFGSVCEFIERLDMPFLKSTRKFINSIIRYGKLSLAERLRVYSDGPGTDDQSSVDALRDQPREAIEQLKKEGKLRFEPFGIRKALCEVPIVKGFIKNGDPEHDARSEMTGNALRDFLSKLKGAPRYPGQLLFRLENRYKHEVSGIWSIPFTRNFLLKTVCGSRLQSDYENAVKTLQSLRRKGALPKEQLTQAKLLERIAHLGLDAFRAQKIKLCNNISNFGIGVGLPLALFSLKALGISSYAPLASLGVVIAIGFRSGVGVALLGKGFGREQLSKRLVAGTAEGVAFGGLTLAFAAAGRFLSSPLRHPLFSAVKSLTNHQLRQFSSSFESTLMKQRRVQWLLGEDGKEGKHQQEFAHLMKYHDHRLLQDMGEFDTLDDMFEHIFIPGKRRPDWDTLDRLSAG